MIKRIISSLLLSASILAIFFIFDNTSNDQEKGYPMFSTALVTMTIAAFLAVLVLMILYFSEKYWNRRLFVFLFVFIACDMIATVILMGHFIFTDLTMAMFPFLNVISLIVLLTMEVVRIRRMKERKKSYK